jgi:preprotein translocase subunit SecA
MEDLRRSVGLRGYAQKDPLNEYKSEAFRAFGTMLGRLRTDACSGVFRMATSMEAFEETMRRARGEAVATGPAATPVPAQPAPSPAARTGTVRREMPKVGRNAVVRIRKGEQTQELKWKKAEILVREDGWELEAVLSE